jgi:hypothetical protein
MNVNPFKIIGWVAIVIAVIGAFVEGGIPYGNTILLLLGLAGGVAVAAEDHVRVLVTALVLTGLSGVFAMNLPQIGGYVTGIFSGLGVFVAGAAFTIFTRNLWRRYKP